MTTLREQLIQEAEAASQELINAFADLNPPTKGNSPIERAVAAQSRVEQSHARLLAFIKGQKVGAWRWDYPNPVRADWAILAGTQEEKPGLVSAIKNADAVIQNLYTDPETLLP